MAQLQWYPGHMAKTKRLVIEKLKLVDFVIELLDARAPLSSRNPMIDEIIGKKPRMIVLTKADIADMKLTKTWLERFKEQGYVTVSINAFSNKETKQILAFAEEAARPVIEREKRQGREKRAMRAMILGIPNVGKSTLINQLVSKRVLTVGDRPGVTKNIQMIRINPVLELMDTPGILWPKFEDPEVAKKLALLGTLKDHLIPIDDIVIYGFQYLAKYHKNAFETRYEINVDLDNIIGIFDGIGHRMGCLRAGNEVDYDRVMDIFLNDFREGRFGKIMLDR